VDIEISLGTEISAKKEIQAVGSFAIPVFYTVLELLTGTKENCKH
jgi:hypothetical protein